MKNKLTRLNCLLILTLMVSNVCSAQNSPTESNNSNTFSSERFGWTIKIPDNWIVSHREVLEDMHQRGLELLGKSDEANKQSSVVYLLNFQKDKRKMFTAIAEPFDTSQISFKQLNKNTKEALCNALMQQGIRIETEWGEEIIDNKTFTSFKLTALNNEGRPIVNQIYYNRQIGNYMFSVILLYDDEETKNILLENWRNSRFSK